MDKKQIGALIAIVAGLLIVIGSIGPWVTADLGPFGSVSKAGVEGDGVFTLLLGLTVIVLAGLSFKFAPKGLGIAAVIASVIAALILIVDMSRAASLLADVPKAAQDLISLGWGIYLALIGSIGAVAGSGMLTFFAFKGGKSKK